MKNNKSAYKRKHITKICPICNKEFSARADKKGIYCSSKCFGIHRTNPLMTCPVCGKDFKGRKGRVTCSPQCAATKLTNRKTIVCNACGKVFERPASAVQKNNFCSRQCQNDYLSKSMAGENHPSWKNGRGLSSGYIMVLQPDGKRIGEHRLVAEELIGRKLLPDEVVHHINGNGLDNSPDNLQVMSRADHMRLHDPRQWGRRQVEVVVE